MADLEGMAIALIGGKRVEVTTKVQQALDEGMNAETILNEGLISGMAVVGERFRRNLIYVPEVLLAANAMKAGMALLEPILTAAGVEPIGKVILGTVKGDLHDIGKNLVASMLEGSGFEIIDLGADVAPEKFVEAATNSKADIICLSALLTVTMPSMKRTIEALNAAGVREKVKVLVGGAPVTPQFAREIGADGYGESATLAVSLARQMMASTRVHA